MNYFEKLSFLMIVLLHIIPSSYLSTPCDVYEFRCNNGECIFSLELCDGHKSCADGSDELNCQGENRLTCPKGYFQCSRIKYCLPYYWQCDGEADCVDESDEENCILSDCKKSEQFECLKNKQCIPVTKRCNGNIDCDDGSDERHCNPSAKHCDFRNEYFPCETDHHCVPRQWLCDGKHDCDDKSDENHCGNATSFTTVTTTTNSIMNSSISPETTEEICPDNYCNNSADCVVIRGQYYCNCSASFSGERCENSISAEWDFHNVGIITGISLTLILLFVFIALMFFYHYKRRTSRYSASLMSKTESQMPIASYSKG